MTTTLVKTITQVETIPNTWNDERDGAFFHLVASLFTPEFSYGTGVLLASYDEETPVTAITATPGQEPAANRRTPIGTELSPQP